ncbi:MAG: hypothetical protein RL336_1314 [Pseudomonadota bacterium]
MKKGHDMLLHLLLKAIRLVRLQYSQRKPCLWFLPFGAVYFYLQYQMQLHPPPQGEEFFVQVRVWWLDTSWLIYSLLFVLEASKYYW